MQIVLGIHGNCFYFRTIFYHAMHKTDKNIVKFSNKSREKITQARKQVVWPLSKTCHICCQKYPCISIFLPDNLQKRWKVQKTWRANFFYLELILMFGFWIGGIQSYLSDRNMLMRLTGYSPVSILATCLFAKGAQITL